MRTKQEDKEIGCRQTWEETSGLLDFLKKVHPEVVKFEETFGFGVKYSPAPPSEIDGTRKALGIVGFVILRDNRVLISRTYCLYSLLKDRTLHGYIGRYDDGAVTTVRELRPLEDFKGGVAMLRDWMRELVKASCEKL